VVQHNAKKNLSELPRAAETECKSTYVNDSLDSVETIEEAIKLPHDFTIRYGIELVRRQGSSLATVIPVIKTLGIS